MGFALTASDRKNLQGVHPDLVRVVEKAAMSSAIRFKVGEGVRSAEQQRKNVAKGVSQTMNSRHLTGHAVDLIPLVDADHDGTVSSKEQWDWPAYYQLAPIIKQAAKACHVPVEWGGDWKSFKDGPHWQLPWKQYPIGKGAAPTKEIERIVREQPPATQKTEHVDKVEKTIVTGGAGATGTGGALSGPGTIDHVTGAIVGQQDGLSSGDWVRIIVAVVVITLTLYGIYRIWKK